MQAAPIRRRSVNEPVHIAPAHIGHRTSLALWWLTARWRNRQVAEEWSAGRRCRRSPAAESDADQYGISAMSIVGVHETRTQHR